MLHSEELVQGNYFFLWINIVAIVFMIVLDAHDTMLLFFFQWTCLHRLELCGLAVQLCWSLFSELSRSLLQLWLTEKTQIPIETSFCSYRAVGSLKLTHHSYSSLWTALKTLLYDKNISYNEYETTTCTYSKMTETVNDHLWYGFHWNGTVPHTQLMIKL